MPANWRLLEAELIDALERNGLTNRIRETRGEKYLLVGVGTLIHLAPIARALADRVTLDSKAVQVKSQTPATDYWHTAGAD